MFVVMESMHKQKYDMILKEFTFVLLLTVNTRTEELFIQRYLADIV